MMDGNDSVQNDIISAVVKFETDAELAAVELFRDYPEPLLRFASVCCVLFMLVGIPGNLITIVALARFKKLRNATAIFIINLHISDLIFCSVILPMTVMTFSERRWTHGVAMCRLFPLFKYVLSAVSIFTVLAISINRYVMVCHPRIYPRLYKRRNLTMMLLAMWISAFLIFLVSLFGIYGRYDLEPKGGFCTMVKDDNNKSPKKILLCVAFFGPYLTIALCYARIWWVVRKSAKETHRPNSRPTHLPIANVQLNASNIEKRHISFEPAISPNSSTEDENIQYNSATSTPSEENILEKYFKAPFRLTRKEVRPKMPTRRDKKLRTVIVAIMLSFCLSHLPVMVTKVVYKEYKLDPFANIFSHVIEYLGGCINPITYVLMSNEYRKAYRNLLENVLKRFKDIGNK